MVNNKDDNDFNFIDTLFGFIKFITILFLILFIFVFGFTRVVNHNTDLMGYRLFKVETKNMKPDYKKNDLVLVKSMSSDMFIKGDVLGFIDNDESIRISKISEVITDEIGTQFVMNDISKDNETVIDDDNIYGKVVYKFGLFSLLYKLSLNTVGIIAAFAIPVLIIILLSFRGLVGEVKKKKLEKKIEDNLEADLESEDDDDDDDDEESNRLINKYYE